MSVITFKTPKSIRKYISSQRGNSRAEYYISIPSLNKMTKLLESVPKLKDPDNSFMVWLKFMQPNIMMYVWLVDLLL